MEGARERFSVILSDEKNEIEELKKIIRDGGDLNSKIKEIKNALGIIESNLKTMEDKFKERMKKIEIIDDEIKELNFEVQSKNIDVMAQVIIDNLPNGFVGVENVEEYDIDMIKSIKLLYVQKCKTNSKKDKEIHIEIGKINILGTENKEFKVEVTLGEKGDQNFKEEEFNISNLYRIYKIIVWINTNLHYYE